MFLILTQILPNDKTAYTAVNTDMIRSIKELDSFSPYAEMQETRVTLLAFGGGEAMYVREPMDVIMNSLKGR